MRSRASGRPQKKRPTGCKGRETAGPDTALPSTKPATAREWCFLTSKTYLSLPQLQKVSLTNGFSSGFVSACDFYVTMPVASSLVFIICCSCRVPTVTSRCWKGGCFCLNLSAAGSLALFTECRSGAGKS